MEKNVSQDQASNVRARWYSLSVAIYGRYAKLDLKLDMVDVFSILIFQTMETLKMYPPKTY